MKKPSFKKIFNALFVVAVFALTVWSVFYGEDLGQLLEFLKTANPAHVVVSVFCVLLFIFGEAVIIFYMLRTLHIKAKLSHCCLYSFVGFFYSCITPSASGGQPMQAVLMRRDGIPVAVSSVILAIITITYKLVLVVIGAIVMIVRPAQMMVYLQPVESMIYLGLALNVVCVAVLLLLVFRPNIVRKIAEWVLSVCNRIRPFRNLQKQKDRLERILGQYEGTAEFYRTHTMVIFKVFAITIVQRLALFFVTWFTYRAFALSGHTAPLVVGLQAMISVAVDMLPLPGGMGISETLFLKIYEPIFGADLVLPGMVISRGISYYTQLLISAVMTVLSYVVIKKRDTEKV